jgi:ribosome-binding factor A
MPLGGQRLAETVKFLNSFVGFFKHIIAKNVKLRYVPQIRFEADTSFEYANRIEKILHDPVVARDLAKDEEEDDEFPPQKRR